MSPPSVMQQAMMTFMRTKGSMFRQSELIIQQVIIEGYTEPQSDCIWSK